MDTITFYLLGVLIVIYLVILAKNKRGKRERRSRKFMDGKKRHSDKSDR